MSLAPELISFYKNLQPPSIPKGITLLQPMTDPATESVMKIFFEKYYADNKPRELLFGINPGRFGGGTTGINFTAPRQLKNKLGIDHNFRDQSELSAEFIYEVIERFGGGSDFFSNFFLTAVCPLGFISKGKNLNYYDDKQLLESIKPFIIQSILKQIDICKPSESCLCIGGEKNLKYFLQFNNEFHFFKKILPLPHPRFIMQYRRKQKEKYISAYLNALLDLRK